MNAMAQCATRQAGQVPHRFCWIAQTLVVEWNSLSPRERSYSLENPPQEALSFSNDLHKAMSVDLELADLLGVSVSRQLKGGTGREGGTVAADGDPFDTEKGFVELGMVRVLGWRSQNEYGCCESMHRSEINDRGKRRGEYYNLTV